MTAALVGAGLPRMHLAGLSAMKRQPFRAGLDKSRVMRDRSPVLCRGRWPPRGAELPGWEARLAQRGGGGAWEGRLS